jgi:putative hydrolases of HD superfamily
MSQDRLTRQLEFLVEIDKLKTVYRRAYLTADPNRREDSAEHSWHTTMLAMVLSEYSRTHIEVARVIEMLMVHDIVEIDTGDIGIYDMPGSPEKGNREQKAAARIFSLLPPDQYQDLMELWKEFEAGTTAEAKFARALNQIIPLIHNYNTQGKRWKEYGITYDQVYSVTRVINESSARLWEYALSLINDSVAKGYLKK